MADHLGSINIPDPPTIAPFPLSSAPYHLDYGGGMDYEIQQVTHVFDQAGLKTEQRYLLGSGARRFRVVKDHLSCHEYDALKQHWILAQGQYAQFPYTHQSPAGAETVTARYENPNLQFDHLIAYLASNAGLTLLEIPAVPRNYTHTARVTRFPDSALTAALENQVQQFVPLLAIQPRGSSDILRVSNQRCTVDGNLYLPRLNQWSGISQTINETSDSATFTLGNADDVWVTYANQTNLYRAFLQFSLFHVNSNYLIDLWAGYARPWNLTSDGLFILPASDGVFELTLGYPWRQLSRTCWKVYKGTHCPSTSPLPDCPKDYNSCVTRGVRQSFGGLVAEPQTVHILDNSTGVWGFGRSQMTSVSIAEDSVYQRPIQEVYTNIPMKVNCDVAAGRDESEFYSALGVVGEGPIGKYSDNLIRHQLDNQPCHDPIHRGGWRGVIGTDPAGSGDWFGLDQEPWNVEPPGSTFAAGLAFAEIRRTDEPGWQLSTVPDRQMTVTVDEGIGGWTWTAPGNRVWTAPLSNTVWVAINVFLRGIGLRVDPSRANDILPAVMERFFDVQAAIDAAAICDRMVESMLVPGTYEVQFPFRGAIKEKKPLKDWIQEILNCCLGYFTFVNGKLWIGIRDNSSVLAGNGFTRATILFKSLQASPLSPRFNWLIGEFGDQEFDWALNSVTLYDIDHALWLGEAQGAPQYLQSTMNFVGVSGKSQCARIITTRLREELGGYAKRNDDGSTDLSDFFKARDLKFKTTLLALRTQVGDIISLEHDRLPPVIEDGSLLNYAEARVQSWTLNPDYSIDITATCTTDQMYHYVSGPKPADVHPPKAPLELLPSINGLAWMPDHVGPLTDSVTHKSLDPLYPDERERTFDLWQDYNITREGIWSPAIWIGGEKPVNSFAPVQPRITDVELVEGGQINGPCTVYVAITQHDASGAPSAPSNVYAVWVPAGLTNYAIVLTMSPAPSGAWSGWNLFLGYDRRQLALQASFETAPPASYTYSGAISNMTRQLPEANARRVRISAKHVWHSGVAGVLVTDVPAADKIQCNDFVGATENWTGRYLSALADLSDGSAPLWNFRVTAFDAASGTFTVSPNCVYADPADSVQVGDVLIARSVAVSATATTVTDPLWVNSVTEAQFPGTGGFTPDEEAGRLVRILRGTGAGQVRLITGNTTTSLTIATPWATIPDATSIVIVEAHDWDYASTTSDVDVPAPGQAFELRLRCDNLANLVALVGGFLVDNQGRITDEEFAVYREIFIYGEPPTVRVVGPQANDPATGQLWEVYVTDTTIRADTSANDVWVQLLARGAYQGRTLYLANDNGPNNLIVNCAPGEFLFDGAASVTVKPHETVRVTAG